MSTIFVDDENQLRSTIFITAKKNCFVYFMNMSLFHRLKFLNHFSSMLRTQYRMIAFIEKMIFELFYDDNLKHDEKIHFQTKSLSKILIKYNSNYYKIKSSLILLNTSKIVKKNNIHSIFNVVNVFVNLKIFLNFVKIEMIVSIDVMILTFYQIQIKIYQIFLRQLIFVHSQLKNVSIKTINDMQKKQASLIILNVIIHNNFEFFKLRNRVNVACFKIMNDMYVIENVIIIMKLKINQRRHFENVFIHIIDRKIRCMFDRMKKHIYVFVILN